MDDPFLKLMKGFADRKHLKKKVHLEFRDEDGPPRLFCDEPAVAARFAAHLKQAAHRKWPAVPLLTRGQTRDYNGMAPGLFRPRATSVDPVTLVKAEAAFEIAIQTNVRLKRLKRPHLGALLQHYGFATCWLDLVDNLWVASWFAAHDIGPAGLGERTARRRSSGTGWIYFISPAAGPGAADCIDLRIAHQGLSLRPHTQHGWSIRGPKHARTDLRDYVVAVLEFPMNGKWEFAGHLGSAEFLFPPAGLDHTLKVFVDRANEVARQVEARFGLPGGVLGVVYAVTSGDAQQEEPLMSGHGK